MKNKLITIIIALLLLLSIAYAPNNNGNNPQGSENPPGQELRTVEVELYFGPFDLSSISPSLSNVISYKLMFIDEPARIGNLRVKRILLSNEGAYTMNEQDNYALIDMADLRQEKNFIVHIANIPFLLYKSENVDGLGNSGYVLVDSRSLETNNPYPIDYQDSRYYALILYNHDNNQGSYAFSDINGLKERQFLAKEESINFKVTKDNQQFIPKDVAQAAVDIVSLETPVSGCNDLDSGSDAKYKASLAYDNEQHIINDFCAYGNDKEILHEAVCNSENKVDIEEIECSNGCKDGACTRSGSVQAQAESCIDTDQIDQDPLSELSAAELGTALSSKGAAVGFFISKESKYALWEDSCATANKLIEYSCKKNKVGFTQVNCACTEGRCVNPPYCVDTDGGENGRARGRVFGLNADNTYYKQEDVCINDKQLKEYACDNPIGLKDLVIECEFGCSEGRCLKQGELPAVEEIPVTTPVLEETPETEIIEDAPAADNSVKTRCSTDYDCNEGEYCITAGVCEKIMIATQASYFTELRNIIARLAEYKDILAQAEAAHSQGGTVEQSAPPTLKANGASCTVNSECANDLCTYANPAVPAKTCMTPKTNGQSCNTNAQCTSNYCNNAVPRVCAARQAVEKANGQSCARGSDCNSGVCYKKAAADANGLCGKKQGSSCRENPECMSLTCGTSRVCAKSVINKPCLQNSDCSTGNCNVNTKKCAAASVPKKANGASCTVNSECANDLCTYANPAVPAKTCMTPKTNGQSCNTHAQCTSNYCNNANPRVCATKPAGGGAANPGNVPVDQFAGMQRF